MRAVFLLALLAALCLATPAMAQDTPWGPLTVLSRTDIDSTTAYAMLGLSGRNKPAGRIYRLRQEIPPHFPAFIPQNLDNQVLAIADHTQDGWLCLYKGPYAQDASNCRYTAMLVSDDNAVLWVANLNTVFPRDTHLEIQDMRYSGGLLFFNEACQSYSLQADGQCSALVCLNPQTMQVLWRTQSLTSNNIFIIHNGVIICGYGFTGEDDFLNLVDAATGTLLSTTNLDSAHDYLEIQGDKLYVSTYNSLYTFQLPQQMQ